ncbi:MAG: mechanosensitive ion channel family protein [Dehalococcoidales bacterium]|nr:mechanosensitive ion channel family protein [Dehalococcoidales bacterium]
MNTIIAWFENYSTTILLATGIILVLLLILRRLRVEDHLDQEAIKYAHKKAAAYKAKHPDTSAAELEKKNKAAVSRYKNLLTAPFAVLSFLSITLMVVSMIFIWQDYNGGEDVTGSVISEWFKTHGLAIVLVLFVAYILTNMLNIIIPKLILQFMERRNSRSDNMSSPQEFEKRSKTMSKVLVSTLNAIVWVMAVLIMLSNIGINITPLLASAGVAGIAISLGAQNLIKDIIAGFFILLEGQYNVGDVVTIAGVTGTVIDINFRRTTLRATDGVRYSIPNGNISISANATSEVSKVYLTIPVAYDADISLVEETINKVGSSMASDQKLKKFFMSPIKFVRVNDFKDSCIDILVSGDTVPGQQWTLAGEFRRRLKVAFDEVGIEIPFNQINVSIDNLDLLVEKNSEQKSNKKIADEN